MGPEEEKMLKLLSYTTDSKLLRIPARLLSLSEIKSNDFITKISEMKLILKKEEDGIGLAATQVNWPVALFILNIDENIEPSSTRIFINPQIITKSKSRNKETEGCLSFKGLSLIKERPIEILWSYTTMDGDLVTETSKNYYARVIQHEVDHLLGNLLIDNISSIQKLKVDKWLKNQ